MTEEWDEPWANPAAKEAYERARAARIADVPVYRPVPRIDGVLPGDIDILCAQRDARAYEQRRYA